MAETVKKTATPAKPRKAASKKKAANSTDAAPKLSRAHQEVTDEQIAQLAHKYWQERGNQHGHDEDDWFRAEQELRGKAS